MARLDLVIAGIISERRSQACCAISEAVDFVSHRTVGVVADGTLALLERFNGLGLAGRILGLRRAGLGALERDPVLFAGHRVDRRVDDFGHSPGEGSHVDARRSKVRERRVPNAGVAAQEVREVRRVLGAVGREGVAADRPGPVPGSDAGRGVVSFAHRSGRASLAFAQAAIC
jgi:hypothetical protein